MHLRRTLVDKCLGSIGTLTGLAWLAVLGRSAMLIVSGPTLARRALGIAGAMAAVPGAVAALYLGLMMLRYPAERSSTAAEIARIAARQRGPLTAQREEV